MEEIHVVGIDVGLRGGMAHVCGVPGGGVRLLRCVSMPVLSDRTRMYVGGRGSVRLVDSLELADWLKRSQFVGRHAHSQYVGRDAEDGTTVVVERSQAMPKQGVVSCFNYGVSYGLTVGACWDVVGRDRTFTVRPSDWKRDLGLGRSKGDSVKMAEGLFGESCSGVGDGVAEAALIGYWRLGRLCSMILAGDDV